MNKSQRTLPGRIVRPAVFVLLAALLVVGTSFLGSTNVEANHPVLLEGNCDSPVPGTTLVFTEGTCGDFDGDGRIGTDEDTDGADRIFGTLKAALGPGTGAAAGTGANHNGKIIIVASGRFAETAFIGQPLSAAFGAQYGGATSPGNVTIEAAPGVHANIDAVLQGDPAGGNNSRQAQWGIFIYYPASTQPRVVTLRNLEIRNFEQGIYVDASSRVNIDRCRIENNRSQGILVRGSAQVTITNSHISANGFRVPGGGPNPGDGLRVEDTAQARVTDSVFAHNANAGISNAAPSGNVSIYQVSTYFNAVNLQGAVTIAANPNHAQ